MEVEDDLGAVVTQIECRMDSSHGPIQHLHNCPSPEDWKIPFSQSTVQIPQPMQGNWNQIGEHVHLSTLLAYFQKIHHQKTQV